MYDEVSGLLRRAIAIVNGEEKSRVNSLTVTKLEEAILWREFGSQISSPTTK